MIAYTHISGPEHYTEQDLMYMFLSDLDRCEHGRHVGDACFGCENGASIGNPRMCGENPVTYENESILGYSIGGTRMWVLVRTDAFHRETGVRVELRSV